MAKPSITVTNIEDSELGIKVEGDLGEVIIEDETDSDNDEDVSENTIATWPQDIIKASSPAVFGTVSVINSENVQFGSNTYFNGPVTIKQIVQNTLEHDNRGFEHTEDEKKVNSQPSQMKQDSPECDISDFKRFKFRWWIKMAMMTFCVAVIGGICAIIFLTLYNTGEDNTPTTVFNDSDPNRCTMVEGLCYDTNSFRMILIPLVLMLLTCICYSLFNFTFQHKLTRESPHTHDITKNNSCGNNSMNHNKQQHCSIFKAIADPLLIARNHLRIVDRTNWLAAPVEKPINVLRLPAPWVIITHTDTESCSAQSKCVLRVRLIQMFHMESRGWNDIGYNFLVGGDGSAYYGRGWDQEGAHTLGYNKYAIGIAFIGTFNSKPPPKQQIEACQKLIKRGVALGKIAKDYKLFGHRQLSSTSSPGDKLFEILKEWPHFFNHNQTDLDDLVPNY